MKKSLIFVIVACACVVFVSRSRVPLATEIPWSTAVYDEHGGLLRLTLSQDEKYRLYVPLEKYPKDMVEALLFKEDKHFREHVGVNPIAMVRAAYHTFVLKDHRMGGSTITMQVARLMYKINTKSIVGKFEQMVWAFGLELRFTKNEILEAYLNLLPYGSNVEGAGTASLIYFLKPPSKLNTPEIFTLAAIPQSPKLRSLGAHGEVQNTTMLIKARNRLFHDWSASRGSATAQDDLAMNVQFQMHGTKDLPFLAPHFVDELLASQKVSEIHSTLNSRFQILLEQAIGTYVDGKRQLGIQNAAAMLIDWTTMEVKATVGSRNFFDDTISGQVNGTKALRSPGSTLKPLAYAMAFEQGLIHQRSLLKDVPVSFAGFDPENFDHDFQGPLPAEQALIRSRNLPAVQLVSQLKQPTFFEFLKKLGLRPTHNEEYYGLSPILGGLEVTMEDLVKFYAMIANNGVFRGLKKIQTADPDGSKAMLSPESTFIVLDILRKMPRPIQGGGSAWSKDDLEVYWKTGTSQGFRDAWTVGIFGPYVLAVWLGNFDGESNQALIGRDLAAPLFFDIFESLRAEKRITSAFHFPPDLNLKKVEVCALSGQIPGSHCHHLASTWFIPGKSPIAKCDIHREILVDKISGLRKCHEEGASTEKQVFEFWPSDLLKLFKMAGMPRKPLPLWENGCAIDEKFTSSGGLAPRITSPKSNVVYSLRAEFSKENQIALNAVADSDVHESFWFVDQSFVGKAKPQEPLMWQPKAGKHLVRVVDDQGRSDTRELLVEVVE